MATFELDIRLDKKFYVKPNVLVSNEGHALLTDFGFSHLAGASFNLAAEQFPGGTLRWMAPEYLDVMDEVKMTTAGDVWAFGMTTLVNHPAALSIDGTNADFYRNYLPGSTHSVT